MPERSDENLLSDKAEEIVSAMKKAYHFKTDKELSIHLGLRSQSVANARKKKVPLRWVLTCQKETGVSLDFLLGLVPERKKTDFHNMSIGTRLRYVRGSLSLPNFAQSLEVREVIVVNWEQDVSYPDAVLITKICDIYQVDPVWLLYGENLQCGRARSCSPAGVNPVPEGWPTTG